jgi:hypothetical protein
LSTSEQDQTGIESDLQTSTQDWVSSILWNGGSGKVDDLLRSQTVYVNQRLATLYPGLSFNGSAPSSDTTFVAATFPASQGRSGMLTQPSWVWAQSDPSLMSIVKRGKAIHDNIVCADPLGPPVDLGTPSALNVIACKSPDGTTTLSACNTEEEQSNSRMTYLPCKNCHSQMDPYSRVIDNFGPIGNYQAVEDVETEAGTDPTGGPVDSTVTFVPDSPLAGQTMTGAPALAKALIASGVYDGCSVQQVASYGIGTQILTYDTCELGPLRTADDGSIQSLITNVLTANFMRARAGGMQ